MTGTSSFPREVLEIIDGKAVTMAHGKVLAEVRDQIGAALQDWAQRIRSKRLSKAKLVKELRQAGLRREKAGGGSASVMSQTAWCACTRRR